MLQADIKRELMINQGLKEELLWVQEKFKLTVEEKDVAKAVLE